MDLIERCKWFNFSEPEFGRRLLLALLRTATEQEGVCGRRSAVALAAVPQVGGYMKLKERRWFRPVLRIRDRLNKWLYETEPPGALIDWVWEGGPITIAVRAETETTSYDDLQALESCMKTLKRQDMPVHGLLIVTKQRRPPERLPGPEREQFLGAILWRDAEQRLRAIRPGSELSCEEWDELLDELCAPGAER